MKKILSKLKFWEYRNTKGCKELVLYTHWADFVFISWKNHKGSMKVKYKIQILVTGKTWTYVWYKDGSFKKYSNLG